MFFIRDLDGQYYHADTKQFSGRKGATSYATEQDCPTRIERGLLREGFTYLWVERGRIRYADIEREYT
jgi:hypothetical protein